MKKLLAFILSLCCMLSICSCKTQQPPAENTPAEAINADEFSVYKDSATGLYGYKDKEGNIVIDCQFDRAQPFYENRALVQKNKALAFIDEYGAPITEYEYISAGKFSNGLAVVGNRDKKYGYIDRDGNVAIDFIYDNATDFTEDGTALAVLDGKTITINKDGAEVETDPSRFSMPETNQ